MSDVAVCCGWTPVTTTLCFTGTIPSGGLPNWELCKQCLNHLSTWVAVYVQSHQEDDVLEGLWSFLQTVSGGPPPRPGLSASCQPASTPGTWTLIFDFHLTLTFTIIPSTNPQYADTEGTLLF